jgi:predicted TIM-barrel fold metal-dependent hydrolase
VRLIDTHVHFWDQRRADLRYPWLEAGVAHPVLGDIDIMKSPLYDVAAFHAESRFAGVEKVVHVEAAARAADPMAEPDWVRSLAPNAELPIAIVAHLDLSAPSGANDVKRLADRTEVQGIRDFGVVRYLEDPGQAPHFEANLKEMEEAGLLLDLDCAWEHMGRAKALADAHPGLQIVLEHIGYPRSRDDAYFANWSPAMRDLATAGNVHCKLSGLGMTDRRWTVESLRRWVATSIEAFGPSRCLFGSNWPVDRIASSYDALVAAFLELISGYRPGEQEAMCCRNAEGLYFA